MPAIVPTHSPEGVEELRRGKEKGLPTEAGGWCSNPGTTGGENAAYGSLGDMGVGCKLTHAPGTTGTSTSTTNDINPALSAGNGCFNGMDRAANCRDRQKPIDVKPQQCCRRTRNFGRHGWIRMSRAGRKAKAPGTRKALWRAMVAQPRGITRPTATMDRSRSMRGTV